MKTEQFCWTSDQDWGVRLPDQAALSPQLVLVFGELGHDPAIAALAPLRQVYPNAIWLGCSTAGEICDTRVREASLVVTAIEFEHTAVQSYGIQHQSGENSFAAGQRLARAFDPDGLRHVFVLSDGIHINGSDLVRGLIDQLPPSTTVTGGLAGDGDRFEKTTVLWNDQAEPELVAAVGLYGDRCQVGFGSWGGWTTFGPKRMITRSKDNVLYEIDGQSALGLYKKYLGDHASELPASGLLFPLNLSLEDDSDRAVVRTILGVDEAEQSMTFAGNMPEGASVQLMRGNTSRLVDGAIAAAENSTANPTHTDPDLAILISCVGRKLVLKQRVEEEIEGIREVLGDRTCLTGFYSYGEIAPSGVGCAPELHNQTMTITTLSER